MMSILTSIIQAILQAICFIMPISESAHSSIYHDFSQNFTGAFSNITGAVHIGIAVGIVVSMYNYFFKLSKEFFATGVDIFKKRLKGAKPSQPRKVMYMSLLSFVPMILWAIPCGKGRFLFSLLKISQYNKTLLDDGLILAVFGFLIIVAYDFLLKKKDTKNISILPAVAVGALSVLFVPVSGFSLIGGIFVVLTLFGVSRKISVRYVFSISVPVLIVMGVVEMCTCNIKFAVAPVIIALVLAALTSFFLVRLFKFIVLKGYIKYFGIYDISIGVIVSVIGIFELVLR